MSPRARQAIQTHYTYEPFGRATISGAPSTSTSQFTGREADGTGLYFYRARYYNPAIGRFISEDPAGYAGSGPNLYAYVRNNPVSAIDPFGLADNATPWQVGWEWLTGAPPPVHHFTDGDPFTELLRNHEHMQKLISDVCNGKLPPTGKYDHTLGGAGGVPKYIRDYSTLFTLGLTGNLAATYLGSFDLSYSLNNGVLSIHVENHSTIGSAVRPPIIGYTEWWSNHVAHPLNNAVSGYPMSKKTQIFDFTESCGRKQ